MSRNAMTAISFQAHEDQVNAIRRDLNASDVWRGMSALWTDVDIEVAPAVEDVIVFTPHTTTINADDDDAVYTPYAKLRWADSPEVARALYPDDDAPEWARYDYLADYEWLRRHRVTPTRPTTCSSCSATISDQHRPLGMWFVARSDITFVGLAICAPCLASASNAEADLN